jgi:hypothetical protein
LDETSCCSFHPEPGDESSECLPDQKAEHPVEVVGREVGNTRYLLQGEVITEVLLDVVDGSVDPLDIDGTVRII